MREPGELVVAQYFSRGAIDTSQGSGRPRTTSLDAEEMALLLRDARCLSKSWHSNIARIRHVDLAGPVLTIASDMVDGTTLEDLLAAARAERIDEREPLLPFPILVRVLVDVLTGVHALHGLRDGLNTAVGAIHGELCPANVVIGKDGVTRLVDVLRSRPVYVPDGSPAAGYAAPETLAPLGTEDPRADVYSVGAILWEGLTGRSLHAAAPAERATPVMHKSSPFARLADVAMRAIAVDPAVRFASAAEMAAELRKIAGTRLATGTAVAARNFELAGDRMRMRKAVLDPATSGMRRRTSERTISAALEARARHVDVSDDAADTAPNPILTEADADAYEFEVDDDALPGPRESSPDVEMEVAMELALAENAMRQRLLTLAPEPSAQPPRSVRPPPPLPPAIVAETPGDFVIPIHVTESHEPHEPPTRVQRRHIAPKAFMRRPAAIAVVAVLMALLATGSFFVLRAQLDASHDGEPRGTRGANAAQPAAPPPAADDITTSVPPALTPQASPSAGARANASASAPRPTPRAPAPAAPAKPKKSIYDPETL